MYIPRIQTYAGDNQYLGTFSHWPSHSGGQGETYCVIFFLSAAQRLPLAVLDAPA